MGKADYDVIIVGAGAAGMMCAIEAGRRGRRVLVVDHAKKPGEKIRISGGGRCNFTNLDIQIDRYLSQNPKFALSALKRYTQWDFIDRVAQAGIAYHEKTLGQLFCDGSAQEIIDMLLADMRAANVRLELNTAVHDVAKDAAGFTCTLGESRLSVRCDSLVVATGGKSIPKMGATGWGYERATQFGLPLIETRAGLVPLQFSGEIVAHFKELSGLSVPATVAANGAQFDEAMLFTHRGLSGPSILQISSYWREGAAIIVNLMPGQDVFGTLKAMRHENGRKALRTALARMMPKRLADMLATQFGMDGALAQYSDKALRDFADHIQAWAIKPVGSEGYRTAEVTLGGVDTRALDAKTMQARHVAGLYFIGEVVDVTGWLGGYNFQWAWSSGWAAGQAV